jgi:hypothetical protein
MNGTASSLSEKGKLWALSRRVLVLIEILFGVMLVWLGFAALRQTILDSRDRDAAAMQKYLGPKPQEEVQKTVHQAPVSKARAAVPATRPIADRPGRTDARAVEQRSK